MICLFFHFCFAEMKEAVFDWIANEGKRKMEYDRIRKECDEFDAKLDEKISNIYIKIEGYLNIFIKIKEYFNKFIRYCLLSICVFPFATQTERTNRKNK